MQATTNLIEDKTINILDRPLKNHNSTQQYWMIKDAIDRGGPSKKLFINLSHGLTSNVIHLVMGRENIQIRKDVNKTFVVSVFVWIRPKRNLGGRLMDFPYGK